MTPPTSSNAFILIEACKKPGCPVCRLEQQAVERYLDHQFYENVNDLDFRATLRHSLGFCRDHAWLAAEKHLGDPLGFALIYQDILRSSLDRIGSISPVQARRSKLRKNVAEQAVDTLRHIITSITPHRVCPACHKRDELETDIISTLVREINNPELRQALQASDALCLAHLRKVLKPGPDPAAQHQVWSIQEEKMTKLISDLDELIRKNDYRFSREAPGEEKDAWLRAIAIVAGANSHK